MNDILAKAREKRMANLTAAKTLALKTMKTAKPVKAAAKGAISKVKK